MDRLWKRRNMLVELGKRLRGHASSVAARVFAVFFVACFSSQAAQPPWLAAFDQQVVDDYAVAAYARNRTILTPEAEIALFGKDTTTAASLEAKRPFSKLSSAPPTIVLKKKSLKQIKSWKELPLEDKAVLLDRIRLSGFKPPGPPPPTPGPHPTGKKPPSGSPGLASTAPPLEPPPPGPVSPASWDVQFYGPDGAIDTTQSFSFVSAEYTALENGVHARPPNGGLIYIGGAGDLSFNDGMAPLHDKQLDDCDGKLCLSDSAGNKLYVPIPIDNLFAEVWDRVYTGEVDSFYLSIDPTEKMLKANAPTPPRVLTTTGARNFRVVTRGDIDKSEIGKIMFDADVFFKSADLGFDVHVGPSASLLKHGFDGRAYSIKGDSVELQSVSHNWCRFYWASSRQTVSVSGNTVKFVGAPVVAKAEAMQIVDGQLDPYPQGPWCGDGQVVAGILNRQAASPANAPLEVQRLVKLGQIRNLLAWAKRAGVLATQSLTAKIQGMRHTTEYAVPEWSSGVFFAPQTQLTVTPGPTIHIYTANGADLDEKLEEVREPAERHWDELLRNAGFHRELDGDWDKDSPGEEAEFLATARDAANWEAGELATKLSGTLKQPGSWQPPEDRLQPGQRVVARIDNVRVHGLPTVVEGGLLLQTLRPDAREVVESPSGHPVFRRDGNTLHFWVLNGGSETQVEYLRLDDAKVVDVSANDGVLRYSVTAAGKPTTALHQVRFSSQVEWSRAFPLASKTSQRDYGFVFDGSHLRRAGADFDLNGSALHDLHLLVRQVAPDRWLVDVPIPDAKRDLDQAWGDIQHSNSIGAAIEHLTELRHFGFDGLAEERGGEVGKWLEQGADDERTRDDVLLALLLQEPSLWGDPALRLDLACALSSSRVAEAALRKPTPGTGFDKAMLALAKEYEPKKRLLIFESLQQLSSEESDGASNAWQRKLWGQEAERFSKLSAQLVPLVEGASRSPVL